VRPRYQPVDIAKTTADLAAVFRAAIEQAGLAFEVDCPSFGEPVYLDREMWETVVLNLLSNALKFTFDGSIRVWLRSEPGHDGHQGGQGDAVLRVADTGTGIP
jgi:signal transduction histidine kinase